MDQYTGIPGLHEPRPALTPDPQRNRESARRLAALEPELACFGHGAPLRDPRKLADFVAGLDGRAQRDPLIQAGPNASMIRCWYSPICSGGMK